MAKNLTADQRTGLKALVELPTVEPIPETLTHFLNPCRLILGPRR